MTSLTSKSASPPAGGPDLGHPLVWGLQLWTLTSLGSLFLAAGASPALRGAFVGNDSWIFRVDHAASLASQAAAITTSVLLVYMGLLTVRAARSPLLGLGAALLGGIPTAILFVAYRLTLPQALTWLSALTSAFCLLFCAMVARGKPSLKASALLAGLSILATAVAATEFSGDVSVYAHPLANVAQVFFGASALLLSLGRQLWRTRHHPLQGACLLGASILLASTASAASYPDASSWIVVFGRSLFALAPTETWGSAAPFVFSLATLGVLFALVSRPGSLEDVLCAFLALGVLAPSTPLTCAWLTLCGFICVALCWTPDGAQRTGDVTDLTRA